MRLGCGRPLKRFSKHSQPFIVFLPTDLLFRSTRFRPPPGVLASTRRFLSISFQQQSASAPAHRHLESPRSVCWWIPVFMFSETRRFPPVRINPGSLRTLHALDIPNDRRRVFLRLRGPFRRARSQRLKVPAARSSLADCRRTAAFCSLDALGADPVQFTAQWQQQ